MAEQTPKSKPKRKQMSGLSDVIGTDGKIGWDNWTADSLDTSKNDKSSLNPKPKDWSFLHLFALVIVLSCIMEYVFSYGSFTLILGLTLSALYSIRSIPHDNIPQGSGYYPLIGHTMNIFTHWTDFFDEEVNECMKLDKNCAYYSTAIPLKKNFIFMVSPKLIDLLFRLRFGDSNKGSEYRENLLPILGHGIFNADGQLWKKHRSIASRMFTVRSLRDYMFNVFVDTTDKWILKSEEILKNDGFVDIYNMNLRLTMEAFTKVAFGVDLGTIGCAPDKVPFADAMDDGLICCTKRFFDVTWKIQKLFNFGSEKSLKKHSHILNDFAKKVIDDRKSFDAENDKNNSKKEYKLTDRYDLLSLFLKEDSNVNVSELRDVCINFIVAGRDTTAQLLSWFMYELSFNPKIEEKIMEEINEYIGDDIDNSLEYKQINECEYLENCLLETLRLRPSVPHLVRYAKCDIALPGDNGHIIRKGDGIVIPTYAMGRMPWIWKDPLKFNPDRFKNENHPPSKYPAFNIPPRLCLGKHVALLEAKIAIVKLFKKYKLVKLPNQNVTYEFSVTNQMKYGYKVKLEPRNQ